MKQQHVSPWIVGILAASLLALPAVAYAATPRALSTPGGSGVRALPKASTTTLPAATDLTVTAGDMCNTLTWKLTGRTALRVYVFRGPAENGPWTLVTPKGVRMTSTYTDTVTTTGTVYYLVSRGVSKGSPVAASTPAANTRVLMRVPVGPDGRTLAAANGALALTVPAGALGTTTTITIEQKAAPASASSLLLAPAYSCTPDGLTFAVPATLSLRYRIPAIHFQVAATLERALDLATFTGTGWVSAASVVDTATDMVSGDISHFSYWSGAVIQPHGTTPVKTSYCTGICHGLVAMPGSTIGLPQTDRQTCYNCHGSVLAASAPAGSNGPSIEALFYECDDSSAPASATTHPVDEGLLCTDCHNPHRDPTAGYTDLLRAYDAVTGRAVEAKPGVPVGAAYCQACHGTRESARIAARPALNGYWARTGGDKKTGYATSAHASQEATGAVTCTLCHRSHGAAQVSLLPARQGLACTGGGTGACHSSASNAAGGSNIYSQLTTSTNNSTHHDVMPAAQAATGARIECSSCHNVHKDGRTRVYSDPDNIAVAIDDGAGAYIDASGYVYALVGAQHDARAPLISNVTLDATTSAQVLVGWALDEIASSYVEIGPTTAYELGAIDASEPTTTPEVVLSTLQAGTLYHFRVRSVDGLGNESVSADAMYRAGNLFHTPVIVPVGEVLSGGSTSVTLQWGAIQPADDHAVEYYVELYSGTTLINQSGWITATSKTYSFNGYGAFNWRVRARDAGHTWVQTAWSANDYFGISYWESRPAGIAVKVPTARVSRLYPLGSFLPGLAVPTSAVPVTTTFAEEYSVDSDRIVLEVEPPGGLNTTVAAAAGWESGGAMVPAPASPGAAVSAETLARAATVDGVHWRTDLASIDRDWNWHVVRFPVTGAGGSTLTLRWTGHGEPTVGYPVRLALYNNETQSWVTEEIGDAPTDRSASTEVQPAAAGFCFACHDGEMPSGVVDPVGLYPVAATWDTGAADAHGSAGGTGVGGSLKAPFERNDPPIACNTCHASHGSQSVYHFPATVNGTAVARVTSGSSSALCSACHVGGLVDWHAECEGCHVADGHWGDQRGVLPTESDDCFSCHTHGSSWTHPDACLFCHSDGELQALGAGPHGPWTYDNTF